MLNFKNDYSTGAHIKVLEELINSNDKVLDAYCFDEYSLKAEALIKDKFKVNNGKVFFLTGGTQTNQVVIDSLLDSYEGVIAAKTGHISCHEAGAIEAIGHKVIELNQKDGKISNDDVLKYLEAFHNDDSNTHMVYPKMLYISFPTEYGTIYTKEELSELYKTCIKYGLTFFIDGARLAYGLKAKTNDVAIEEFAEYCDVFYVGGTKVGALCGEAIVFKDVNQVPKAFLTRVKRQGAMLAKSRLNGVQFYALFKENLYFEIGEDVIEKSLYLKEILISKGYKLFIDSPTNQQFIIIENEKLAELKKHTSLTVWEKYDDNKTVIRFVVSYSTTKQEIEELSKYL